MLGTRPNHFEMINALAFWPKGRLLASASDDTTVRYWRLLNDRSLSGDPGRLASGNRLGGLHAGWIVRCLS